jgi:hypothetical protein
MKSLGGKGGDFDDIEFCDTSEDDPAAGGTGSQYGWWQAFSEGKRFYVPDVAKINNTDVVFNIKALTGCANELLQTYPSLYSNCENFGRKSFEKIVANKAMSFPKAVLATRTINVYLKDRKVQKNGSIMQIGKCRIMMSGYRVEGMAKALGYFTQATAGHIGAEGAVEYVAREADVADFIIEALNRDDSKFVVFPTALAIIRALLRNRDKFGIPGEASEPTFLRLGPPPGASFGRLDLRFSVPETGDPKEGLDADPKFRTRAALCPHPENPYRRVA